MRLAMLSLAVGSVVVSGCDTGCGSPFSDCAILPGEVGADVDSLDSDDSDAPVATGSVAITYELDSVGGAASCADAGVSGLDVSVGTYDSTDTTTFPCDGGELRITNLAVGPVLIWVTGDSTTGATYHVDAVEVVIEEDVETPVNVVLACDDNGVADGCGGA